MDLNLSCAKFGNKKNISKSSLEVGVSNRAHKFNKKKTTKKKYVMGHEKIRQNAIQKTLTHYD